MMRARIVIAAAVAACAALPARAEWVVYQRDAEVEELFDPAGLSREQSRIRLWTLTNHAQPRTSLEALQYQSEKTLTTVDCAARKSGAEQVIRYSERNAGGDVVGDMKTPLRLTSVREGSADEILLKRLCR